MDTNKRKILELDATGQSAGRLATKIALALRGKDQPDWQPHLDSGAVVEIKNIRGLKFTGKKFTQKVYRRHTGYPGGLKETKLSAVWQNKPAEILRRAVRLMLPETRLRAKQLKRLKIN